MCVGRRVRRLRDVAPGARFVQDLAVEVDVCAEVVGVSVLVWFRRHRLDLGSQLPTGSVGTCLQVLEPPTAGSVLDPALKKLTVDAIVNQRTDGDPRWDLLPVTASGPLTVPLRQACPVAGASPLADSADAHP